MAEAPVELAACQLRRDPARRSVADRRAAAGHVSAADPRRRRSSGAVEDGARSSRLPLRCYGTDAWQPKLEVCPHRLQRIRPDVDPPSPTVEREVADDDVDVAVAIDVADVERRVARKPHLDRVTRERSRLRLLEPDEGRQRASRRRPSRRPSSARRRRRDRRRRRGPPPWRDARRASAPASVPTNG